MKITRNNYKHAYLTFILLTMLQTSWGQTSKKTEQNMKHEYSNELIHESSPYLLQHAHNPVNWYPWGDKALKKAKDENKMLIISIGYSACHWCHVMEHESFEDTAVARIMNENFVCIKVDREERPDVDQLYMYAAQLINGSGGWPLNALALADGTPFYAATYFPKNDWVKMLNYFIDINRNNPEKLKTQAQNITNNIHSIENIPFIDKGNISSMTDMNAVFNTMKQDIDFIKGGGNRAPKFPMPSNWEYLLNYHYASNNNDALRAVDITLKNMAFGGIYDHLGGGFARYSTDADWHVPHFEKMLYDNAQLVSLYSHAYQLTKNPLYKKVVYETLAFVQKEMTSAEKGFYSGLDADSDGEEGKFYVWTKSEIETALGGDAPLFIDYYNITNTGNWEHGKNILLRTLSNEDIAKNYKITVSQLIATIGKSKVALLKIRDKRIKPRLDDKILSSWNALMLTGYVNAYRTFGDEQFLQSAIANAEFITQNMIAENNAMTRNYKNGKSSINAFLDDYAFTISAFIQLYQATFNEKWLNKAKMLTEYTITHFFDTKSGMFYYTHNEYSNLIARKMEIADNVIPSSNSEMAKNLFLLGNYFVNDSYLSKSKQMLLNVQKNAHQDMYFYSNWGIVELNFLSNFYEVAIVGENFQTKRKELDKLYLPNILLVGGKEESTLELLQDRLVANQTMIYVCSKGACQLPVKEVSEAVKQMKKF